MLSATKWAGLPANYIPKLQDTVYGYISQFWVTIHATQARIPLHMINLIPDAISGRIKLRKYSQELWEFMETLLKQCLEIGMI